jgi:signal transduction histidine kinase
MSTHGLDCQLACDPPVLLDDPNVASHLFRIAQEAVNNAVRHAKARRITIALSRDANSLRLSVTDDGKGPKGVSGDHRGLGLRHMEQRSLLLGGQLTIEPGEIGGTVVACRVPVAAAGRGFVSRAEATP